MSDKLPALLSGVVADAMTGFASGGAATGGAVAGIALSKLFEKRLKTARDILTEQLRRGDKTLNDVADLEEAVAVTYRYARAAQEGAARLNLRLMAKVIAGQAHLGNLVADDFLYYADLLASLRREEVILIATIHRHKKDFMEQTGKSDKEVALAEIWPNVEADLIPVLFEDKENLLATATAASRTGLLTVGQSYGGFGKFSTSPLMNRLGHLVDFEDALREEGIATGTSPTAES